MIVSELSRQRLLQPVEAPERDTAEGPHAGGGDGVFGIRGTGDRAVDGLQVAARCIGHDDKIAALRRLILTAGHQKTGPLSKRADAPSLVPQPWTTGVADIDAALPAYGLNRHGVHEVMGGGHSDTAAASAYMLALLNRLPAFPDAGARRFVLFCQTALERQEFGTLYGNGLRAFGLNPADIILVRAKNDEVLWALEEGARAGCLRAVIGELDTASFTQTRRLTLAAAAGETPILLLRPQRGSTTSAAETRWQVSAQPGNGDPLLPKAPHTPRWRIELSRCRGGRTGAWTVEWNYEAYRFGLFEQLPNRLSEMAHAPGGYQRLRQASG